MADIPSTFHTSSELGEKVYSCCSAAVCRLGVDDVRCKQQFDEGRGV